MSGHAFGLEVRTPLDGQEPWDLLELRDRKREREREGEAVVALWSVDRCKRETKSQRERKFTPSTRLGLNTVLVLQTFDLTNELVSEKKKSW